MQVYLNWELYANLNFFPILMYLYGTLNLEKVYESITFSGWNI